MPYLPLWGMGAADICAAPSLAVLHGTWSRNLESFVGYSFENVKSWQNVVNEKSVLWEYKNVCTSEDHAILFKEALLLRGLWILNQNFVVRGMLLRRKEMYFLTRFLATLTHSLWLWAWRWLKYILHNEEKILHSVGSCHPASPWMPPLQKETWVLYITKNWSW